MSLENTAEDLIQQVRDVCDEDNTSDVSDAFLLRMLNRAQQDLISEITRKYNPHFMQEVYLAASDFVADGTGNVRKTPLPTQGFGFRVNSVEVKIGQTWHLIKQVPHKHTLPFDGQNLASLPVVYSIQGGDLFLFPDASTVAQVRLRY